MSNREAAESGAAIDEIDLAQIIGALWRRKLWIAVSGFLSAAAFGVVAFMTPPAYRASTVLVSVSAERGGAGALSSALGQLGGLAALAGINLESSGTEEAIAVLKSRQFSEAFIRDHDLMSGLFPEKWDVNRKRWNVSGNAEPTLAQAFRRFDRRVRSVTIDPKTGLLTVSMVWSDPVVAAQLANDLVRRLNEEMRDRAIARTGASVAYLEKELRETSEVDTRQAIARLIESQLNQRMYANVTQEYALRVLSPALPPDLADRVRPQKAMMIAVGGIVGGLLSVLGIFMANVASKYRPRDSHSA